MIDRYTVIFEGRILPGKDLQRVKDRLKAALKTETGRYRNHAEKVRSRMATDLALAQMCGNRLYQAVAETLIRLTQEIIIAVKPEKVVFHDQREHDAIVRAVLDKDAPAAAAAMSRHLNSVGAGLVMLEKDFRRKLGVADAKG